MYEADQFELFVGHVFGYPASEPESPNPMVRLCGDGPADAVCRRCRHLMVKDGGSRKFRQCRFRFRDYREDSWPGRPLACFQKNFWDTNGEASDHKAKWPACARFERA